MAFDRSCRRDLKVLVMGAGPAGITTALRLQQHGIAAIVVERETFPRDKLCGCCLNLAGLASASVVGCDHLLRAAVPQPLSAWEMRLHSHTIRTSLPGGIALRRSTMDSLLADESLRRGIDLRMGCEATISQVSTESQPPSINPQNGSRSREGIDVILRAVSGSNSRGGVSPNPTRAKGTPSTHRFDVVVVATGLAGTSLSRWAPWKQPPSGPLGIGLIVDNVTEVVAGTIHMVVGDKGYAGLVRLEDGRVDIAAALRVADRRPNRGSVKASSASPRTREQLSEELASLLLDGGFGKVAIDPLQLRTSARLTRSRTAGWASVLLVGDAAGYVEPFTGEGMAWAMQSGIAAADTIAQWADRSTGSQTRGAAGVGDRWAAEYRGFARNRQWTCRAIGYGLAHNRSLACANRLLRIAPWATDRIVRRVVKRLNRIRV